MKKTIAAITLALCATALGQQQRVVIPDATLNYYLERQRQEQLLRDELLRQALFEQQQAQRQYLRQIEVQNYMTRHPEAIVNKYTPDWALEY